MTRRVWYGLFPLFCLLCGCATLAPDRTDSAVSMSAARVIGWTNIERRQVASLTPLSEDQTLDAIARSRAADMFAHQYFAHVSPSGDSAQTEAVAEKYSYITIGENIALGGFQSEDDLVQQWMNSPGHRANILAKSYTHIGAAVMSGTYAGEHEWIGVQVFAAPLSLCPSLSDNMKAEIDANTSAINSQEEQAKAQEQEINNMSPGPQRTQAVTAYNKLVTAIRQMQTVTNDMITKYDAQIAQQNDCIETYQKEAPEESSEGTSVPGL